MRSFQTLTASSSSSQRASTQTTSLYDPLASSNAVGSEDDGHRGCVHLRHDGRIAWLELQFKMETRTTHLKQFREDKVPVLVVTDVAARGLDIPLVNVVIHFDCPTSPKLYVHRTGRTARGGREGTSVVFVSVSEIPYFLDIALFLNQPIETTTDQYATGCVVT